jgi:hypothetical protein
MPGKLFEICVGVFSFILLKYEYLPVKNKFIIHITTQNIIYTNKMIFFSE